MTYVVVENTPGYLPDDDNPFETRDLEEAKQAIKDEVQRLCDHLDEIDEPYQVHWAEDGTAAFVQEDREHALGRSFEILDTPIG